MEIIEHANFIYVAIYAFAYHLNMNLSIFARWDGHVLGTVYQHSGDI